MIQTLIAEGGKKIFPGQAEIFILIFPAIRAWLFMQAGHGAAIKLFFIIQGFANSRDSLYS